MKSLTIFDLDGTLLNTIDDLGNACNHALRTMGYPTHGLLAYPMMVGKGITRLIERALPDEARTPEIITNARNLLQRSLLRRDNTIQRNSAIAC